MAKARLPKATATQAPTLEAASPPPADAVVITPKLLRRWALPTLDGTRGTQERGTALVIGGTDESPGAVLLASLASLRAGAGTAVVATTKGVAPGLAVAYPEARVIGLPTTSKGELGPTAASCLEVELASANAILVGPGMRSHTAPTALLAAIAKHAAPTTTVIADAGALAALPMKPSPTRFIITPHAGELARLLDTTADAIQANPLPAARKAAQRLQAIVILKGATTYITSANGELFTNAAGSQGLGTSGSGDTLAGIITGLCARGATPMQAAVWGVYVHARAGEVLAKRIAPLGVLARELLDEIPRLVHGAGGTRR